MNQDEKIVLYLTDFPLSITNAQILDFLSKYKYKNIFINPEQNQKNLDIKKPISVKVLFYDHETADKCRKEMNLRKINKKSIRIMWDEKDSSIRYNTKNNLFFKNIPKSTSPREVYEYFQQFGDISSCKMTEDDFGNHYGYGYVTYYNPDDAQNALEKTKDKKLFENNIIDISYFQGKNERLLTSNNTNNQKIYINNLPDNYKTENLIELCKQFGEVKSCNIFKDNLNKNFGIVQFSSEEEAKDVLNKLDGKEIEGEKLNVKLYQTKFEHKQYLMNTTQMLNEKNINCNLYIRNIPLTANEDQIKEIFQKFGNILSIRIEKTKKETEDGKIELINKGYGYVSYDNPESAKKAIEELNGKYLPGFESWSRTLSIEIFMTKYERQVHENQESNLLDYYSNQNNRNENNLFFNPYIYPQNNQIMQFPMNQNNFYEEQARIFPIPINYNINYFNFQFNLRRGDYNNRFHKNNNRNYYNNSYNNSYNYNNNYYQYREKKIKNENFRIKNNNSDFSEYYKLEKEEEKKKFLGDKIYKAIEQSKVTNDKELDAKTIGKITRMIIETHKVKKIQEMLENSKSLNICIEGILKLIN